ADIAPSCARCGKPSTFYSGPDHYCSVACLTAPAATIAVDTATHDLVRLERWERAADARRANLARLRGPDGKARAKAKEQEHVVAPALPPTPSRLPALTPDQISHT